MRAKTWLPILAVTAAVTAIVTAVPGVTSGAPPAPDTEASRIQKGYQIAPVPLRLRGRDRALVGLGSYIVNAQGGCNDCHTNPPYAEGGDPFLGQPAIFR